LSRKTWSLIIHWPRGNAGAAARQSTIKSPDIVNSIVVVFDVASGERKGAFALPAGNAGASDILDRGHYLSVPMGRDSQSRAGAARGSAYRTVGRRRKGYGESPVGPGFVQCLQWAKDGRSMLFAKSEDGVTWQIMRFGAGWRTLVHRLGSDASDLFRSQPRGSRIAFDGTSYVIRRPE